MNFILLRCTGKDVLIYLPITKFHTVGIRRSRAHRVECLLDASLKAGSEVGAAAGSFCIFPAYFQCALGHASLPDLPYPNQADPWPFIEGH